MRKKIIILATFLLGTSCTLGPDYETPTIYSDAIMQNELELKKGSRLPNDWYKNLSDDYLQNLIEKGLKNNPDIVTAKARLKQARLTAKVNGSDYLPQISATGGYNYEKGSENIKYSQDIHYYQAGFDASWEIDIWGKGRRQSEADEANVQAQKYNLSNIKTVIAAEIASNYIRLMQNKANLRKAKQNADLQKQIVETVKREYQSGMGDAAAYNQAEYLLQTTLASIPQYENNVEIYKNALSVLTGFLPSENNVPERSELLNGKYADMTNEMRNLPASVIRLRPDVAAAEQKFKAQNALIGKAIAELYPDVSVSGFFGYSSQGGKDLFSSASEGYNYTSIFKLPLLDWNKLQNNVKIQEQEKNIALADYKQSVLNAVREIKNAFSNYKSALDSYHNKSKALNSMQKVNDIMLKRYHSGLIKFSEVLDSQQNLINAQDDVINARAQVSISIISYYKASGAVISNN